MTKRTQFKGFLFGLLVAVGVPALAATFNLFSPATGILKGNSSTYVTTAATSADVVATFSGTCNSGSVLKGDGTCAVASTGTVTSVGLTMPSGFSVSGSPVTTTGTLGVTTTLNGPLRGTGSGIVADSLTGLLKGNGTSAITSAVASDVYGLWAGGCSSSNFLRGDGTCASPGGGGTVTSVAAGTGLSASPSPITSSGTLSLNLANANTWTGLQTFTPTASPTIFRNTQDEQIRMGGSGAGTNPYISFFNTSGTRIGYVQVVPSSSQLLIANEQSGGSIILNTAGGGIVSLPAGSTVNGTNICLSNGTNCPAASIPKFSYAQFSGNGSDCNPPAGWQIANITSCTRNSTGQYQANFTSAYATNNPICTVSSTSSTRLATVTTTTGFATISLVTLAGAAQDGGVTLSCIGT